MLASTLFLCPEFTLILTLFQFGTGREAGEALAEQEESEQSRVQRRRKC